MPLGHGVVVQGAATHVTRHAAERQPQAAEPHVAAARPGLGELGHEGLPRRLGDDDAEVEAGEQQEDRGQGSGEGDQAYPRGHQQYPGHQAILQLEVALAEAGEGVEQGQGDGGLQGIHPAHRRGAARHLLDQDGEDKHHLHPERVVAAQDQHQSAERLVGQYLAEAVADRGRSHRELVGRQDQQIAQGGADEETGTQQADIFEVEVQQPAAEQGAHHGAGALQHHQQGDVAAPFPWPGELDDQGGAGGSNRQPPRPEMMQERMSSSPLSA